MRIEDTNIVANSKGVAAQNFDQAIGDFEAINYTKPSEYVTICWEKYKNLGVANNNINGKVFEYIIATLFIRERILPLFIEAKVAFVPNVSYDLLLYSKEVGPICCSLKTSLRERYKQADLEAIALKYVHRRAQCYLFTFDSSESLSVKKKIKTGDVIGLNAVINCNTADIDELFEDLKAYDFIEPGSVDIITCNRVVAINT